MGIEGQRHRGGQSLGGDAHGPVQDLAVAHMHTVEGPHGRLDVIGDGQRLDGDRPAVVAVPRWRSGWGATGSTPPLSCRAPCVRQPRESPPNDTARLFIPPP